MNLIIPPWSQVVLLWEGVENVIIAGQVVAALADDDVLYGDGLSKLAAMRTPYITNRSVDAASWTATPTAVWPRRGDGGLLGDDQDLGQGPVEGLGSPAGRIWSRSDCCCVPRLLHRNAKQYFR